MLGPHVLEVDLSSAYERMAVDLDREKAAIEWSESSIRANRMY